MFFDCSHDFSRQTGFSPFCVALWKRVTYGCMPKGDGEEGKRGTGGENPEGEGGLQPGCPPSPGCLPKTSVNLHCVGGLVQYYEQHRRNPKQGTAGGSRFPMQTGLHRGLLQGIDTSCHDDAAA